MASDLVVQRCGDNSGPTIVLLHAGVADARAWDAAAEGLTGRGLQVIAPDLRGFGRSPDPVRDFRHVDDVLDILDGDGIETPVTLVGWSMSGTIALDLALEHPDRVAALVLVCSVPEPLPRSQVVLDAWERENALVEAGDHEGAIANDIATWGAGTGRTAADLAPELVAHMTEVARDQLARADRAGGEALDGDRDAIYRLGELRQPLLVITADLDTPCHEDAARFLVERVPDVQHVQLTGAAHMAPMELPDDVATLIADHALRTGR